MSVFTLHQLIVQQAQRTPLATALICKEQHISYEQLAGKVSVFAQWLSNIGIRQSERIGIYLPKTIETVVSLFASSAAGAVFVPLNPVLKAAQVQYILNDCGVRLLITSSERLQSLQKNLADYKNIDFILLTDKSHNKNRFELNNITVFYLDDILNKGTPGETVTTPIKVIDADIAAIFYTSGSTGQPKGVVLSQHNLLAGAQSVSQYLHNKPDDKILAVLPFSFDYGFSQLTTAFYVGAGVVLMDYLFPKDVIKAVEKYQITGLAAVPPLWIQLAQLDWPENCSLQYFTNSGGSLPVKTLDALRDSLPSARPYLMYGLTEAFRSTYVPPENVDTHKDAIGIAIPNAEVLVLREDGSECADNEPGELVHRGSLVAQGYWNAPEKTARRFKPYSPVKGLIQKETVVWSGDTVRRAEDGYLYFISRKDDMIKTSGYRISPDEIEQTLHQSGLIKECAALGISHPVLGQAVIIVVVPMSDNKNPAAEIKKLRLFCKKNLPNYMQPAEFFIKNALARNQNGKIDRKQLSNNYKNLFQDQPA